MKLIYLLIAFSVDNPEVGNKYDLLSSVFETEEECISSKNEIEAILRESDVRLNYTCHPVFSITGVRTE